MSTEAPERSGGGGGLDDFFGKKYGPLPGWGWAGIAAGGAYLYYRAKHNASAASTSSTASTGYSGTTPFDYAPSIATLQSEVQGLQAGESGEGTTTATPPTTTTTSSTTHTGGSTTTPTSGPVTAQTYSGPKSSLAAATSYLQGQGYQVTNVSLGGQNLSAAQIAQQQGTAVYSVTPYSNKTARIGLE